MNELQKTFELLMSVPINAPVRVIASKKLKIELKILLVLNKIFEKVTLQEVLTLYESKGGSKQEIKDWLKK